MAKKTVKPTVMLIHFALFSSPRQYESHRDHTTASHYVR
jgi:hypothetical protein